jgi:hypothetical protein
VWQCAHARDVFAFHAVAETRALDGRESPGEARGHHPCAELEQCEWVALRLIDNSGTNIFFNA